MKKRVLLCVVLVIVAFVGGCFVNFPKMTVHTQQTKEKPEREVITVAQVESTLKEISEFSTYSSDYSVSVERDTPRYVVDTIRIPNATNHITLTGEGVVKVGIDLTKVEIKVDDVSNSIYIKLPEIEYQDNYIRWDTIECVEDNKILNPIQFAQYKELVLEMQSQGLEDAKSKDIERLGTEHVKQLITVVFGCFDGYKVEFL